LDWNASTLWWLLAGVLVAAELATGSFYLLMLALGCVAGAITAHMGMGLATQLLTASVLGAGATTAWHLWRRGQPGDAPVQSNRDANLDIGQTVHVAAWQHDGTARVPYRGATWSVRWDGTGAPVKGDLVIVALNGNELRLAPGAPGSHQSTP
jgi:membrane protein implicated in regulation of membrane protease activity